MELIAVGKQDGVDSTYLLVRTTNPRSGGKRSVCTAFRPIKEREMRKSAGWFGVLASFTNGICKTLDKMIDGKIVLKGYTEETLLARIVHQLEKLYSVMIHQKSSVDKERAELQELISDISHQTKTPITNLKMINGYLAQWEPNA